MSLDDSPNQKGDAATPEFNALENQTPEFHIVTRSQKAANQNNK